MYNHVFEVCIMGNTKHKSIYINFCKYFNCNSSVIQWLKVKLYSMLQFCSFVNYTFFVIYSRLNCKT